MFGDEFETLLHDELAHAAVLNDELRRKAQELGVRPTATMDPDRLALIQQCMDVIEDRASLFAQRWRGVLAGRTDRRLRVLEFACGSANDYRALHDYGLAALLDYTGIDLNEKNIANAKRRFPDVDFRVGSILSLPDEDDSADYVIGADILEHLSLEGMFTALATAERIARRGLYFALFRMDYIPEHKEVPRKSYHYNLLSYDRMREYMEARYESVQLIRIATMFADEYDFHHAHQYNPRAFSLITEHPLRARRL